MEIKGYEITSINDEIIISQNDAYEDNSIILNTCQVELFIKQLREFTELEEIKK